MHAQSMETLSSLNKPDARGMASATQKHLDGPALPHLGHFPLGRGGKANAGSARLALVPVLTPPITGTDTAPDDDGQQQQYLIVPNERRIVVRSAHHGRRVCELTASSDGVDGELKDVTVRTVSLAWLAPPADETVDGDDGEGSDFGESSSRGEHVVLAGYSDGTLREWPVADIASPKSGRPGGLASRRVFRLGCGMMRTVDLVHLSTPIADADVSARMSPRGGAAVYAWIKGLVGKKMTTACLGRVSIPAFSEDGPGGPVKLEADELVTRETVSSKTPAEERAEKEREHVCLRKHDDVIHLVSSHRQPRKGDGGILERYNLEDGGAPRGEVHVVMVASHGLVFYRDTLDGGGKRRQGEETCRLVHYSRVLKTSQHYSTEQSAFSAVSVSPGTADLALGRANGHIELLVGVFENNSSYLDGLDGGGGSSSAPTRHPEEVTVRRTMHWHAHPVRTLAYVSSGGRRGAPPTLVSGGEESVLVTWQLERNHHRPSDFVARVGRGGIVRLIPCPDTGRTFVFCADNSVQCYDSTSSERSWCVQGVASMALHEEGTDDGKPKGLDRGPVVVVRDPITNYPMMTNLPGAPGMVHWYDPKSSSVVGTLEVAPYNRVSRRDPLTDPHVPAPTVTHMAVGDSGRDMVTVDEVWSENTSVGAARELTGPGGDAFGMSVCTSVKFWSHSGSSSSSGGGRERKRRAGDLPMDYELVSSMAAPHGRGGGVCALAVAPGGGAACTLSREEDAYRLWTKIDPSDENGTMWQCSYRVKTPSGFSNSLLSAAPASLGQRQLVRFSNDGSVLAVCYGAHVTLWDHSSATLLNDLALDQSDDGVRSVEFSTKSDDTLLVSTAGALGALSPFGGVKSCYLGGDEWTFDVAGMGATIAAVVPLGDFGTSPGGCFAVAANHDGTSTVSVVDRAGASVAEDEDSNPIQWRLGSEVQSMSVDHGKGRGLRLLVITKDSDLISLSYGDSKQARKDESMPKRVIEKNAPVLQIGQPRVEPGTKRRKVSILTNTSRSDAEQSASIFDFPERLSSRFTASFITKG